MGTITFFGVQEVFQEMPLFEDARTVVEDLSSGKLLAALKQAILEQEAKEAAEVIAFTERINSELDLLAKLQRAQAQTE